MERTIHLDKEVFEAVKEGKKKFEVRLGDEKVEEGDIMVIKQRGQDGEETGKEIRKKVEHLELTKDMAYWPEEKKQNLGFTIIQLGDI